jgi:hypothetical protein
MWTLWLAAALAAPTAWPERAWHIDLLARTDFPIDVGLALDVETPQRLRFGLGLGLVPGPYLRAIDGIAVAAGWYDQPTADLIEDTVTGALTLHPVIGVRPLAKEGFVLDAGFKLALLGGRNTTAGLVSTLTGQTIPDGGGDDARELRAGALLGMVTVRVGWVWEPVDRLAIRFDIGGNFTVSSTSQIRAPEGAVFPAAWEPLTRAGEVYLDETFTRWVHTPTIGIGVGWRAR